MKFILLFFLTSIAMAGKWEIIGQTSKCEEKIMIEAKEGDNNVHVIFDGKKYILFAQGNYVFMSRSPFPLVFDSYNRKKEKQKPRFVYTHPGQSMKEKGTIKVINHKESYTCDIKIQN